MTLTQQGHDGILRQALELPDEKKARLLEEMLQHELGSSAENNRPFLEKLDEALTRLEVKIQSRATGRKRGRRKKCRLSTVPELSFDVTHIYASTDGIEIPLMISFGGKEVQTSGYADCDAEACIFSNENTTVFLSRLT